MLNTPEAAPFGKTKGPLVATAGAIMLIAERTSEQVAFRPCHLNGLTRSGRSADLECRAETPPNSGVQVLRSE
jgi:hypothetical protein